MILRAATAVLLACLLGLLVGGCRRGPATAASAGVQQTPSGDLSQAFEGMRRVLAEAAAAREARDAPGLRARSPRIVGAGLALLRSRMPHDLRRADVARYHEGRAEFGTALKAWASVVETGPDDAILESYDGLVDTYRGWLDASRGLPPERSV